MNHEQPLVGRKEFWKLLELRQLRLEQNLKPCTSRLSLDSSDKRRSTPSSWAKMMAQSSHTVQSSYQAVHLSKEWMLGRFLFELFRHITSVSQDGKRRMVRKSRINCNLWDRNAGIHKCDSQASQSSPVHVKSTKKMKAPSLSIICGHPYGHKVESLRRLLAVFLCKDWKRNLTLSGRFTGK